MFGRGKAKRNGAGSAGCRHSQHRNIRYESAVFPSVPLLSATEILCVSFRESFQREYGASLILQEFQEAFNVTFLDKRSGTQATVSHFSLLRYCFFCCKRIELPHQHPGKLDFGFVDRPDCLNSLPCRCILQRHAWEYAIHDRFDMLLIGW